MWASIEEALQSPDNQWIQLWVGGALQPCVHWVCAQRFQESLFSVATLALKLWIYSRYYSVALKSGTVNDNCASPASPPRALFSTSSIHSSNEISSNHFFSISTCSVCLGSMSCIQKFGERIYCIFI